MNIIQLLTLLLCSLLVACSDKVPAAEQQGIEEVDSTISETDTLTTHLKPFREDLPTIGLLMYNGCCRVRWWLPPMSLPSYQKAEKDCLT